MSLYTCTCTIVHIVAVPWRGRCVQVAAGQQGVQRIEPQVVDQPGLTPDWRAIPQRSPSITHTTEIYLIYLIHLTAHMTMQIQLTSELKRTYTYYSMKQMSDQKLKATLNYTAPHYRIM